MGIVANLFQFVAVYHQSALVRVKMLDDRDISWLMKRRHETGGSVAGRNQ